VTGDPDDDIVPVSVRLGQVVAPEDPEDWTRPLTWVAALGLLAGPMAALSWFVVAPPGQALEAAPGTYAVAAAIAGGAGATGATQHGAARAATATLGAGLFGALVVVILGVVMAGERQVGSASPTVAHAFTAGLGGLVGTAVASGFAAVAARRLTRRTRFITALVAGASLSLLAVWTLRPW
jgi:hypothetical protein